MQTSAHGNTILTMLTAKYSTELETNDLTTERIKTEIESLIKAMRFTDILAEERQYIAKKLMFLLGVTKDNDECLVNQEQYGSHLPTWFTDIKDKHDEWYAAYQARLCAKHWSYNVIQKLGESSDAIMNYLGNPSEASFNVRGLIMGDIQSGKTANFIALCNKAADAGYRVIIVTAGIIEKLRQQTQERLENEFVNLLKNKTIPTLTGISYDFKKEQGKNPISVFRKDVPVLCVIKKNVSVLQHLYDWLQKGSKDNNKLPWPLLFVDDEADNASINTKKLSEEANPTKTNEFIRKILNLFSKSSYIGITATPFANVFIDPESDDIAIANDLFPKSFVYRLTTPSNYFGNATIFATGSIYIKDPEDLEEWLPENHKREAYPSEPLPDSLQYAIAYFLLINGIMDFLSEDNDIIHHRTMMIHISRFIPIQNRIAEYVDSFVRKLVSRVANYCGDTQKAENVKELILMHKIWDDEKLSLRCNGMCWASFLKNYLFSAIQTIETISVNSNSNKSLDYMNGDKRVIVIGGNALSRGLTLEGLVVSYFRRKTMISDTLLQMGRWCGYRDLYKELVRLWIPVAIVDHFGYASQISEDISQMFHQMVEEKCSPMDFAIKIRKDPGSMLPTARNKMRTASVAKIPIILAGHAIETPRMRNDPKEINLNNQAVIDFLLENKNYIGANAGWDTMCFYRSMPIEKVSKFLSNFKTGVMSYGFFMQDICKYIEKHYTAIDIVIQSAKADDVNSKNIGKDEQPFVIKKLQRQLSLNSDQRVIQINGTKLKVTSGGVMKYILDAKVAKENAEAYKKKYDKSPSDSYFLALAEESHPTPLLVLQYVSLSKDSHPNNLACKEFFALSIGFPGIKNIDSDTAVTFYLSKKAYDEYITAEMEE